MESAKTHRRNLRMLQLIGWLVFFTINFVFRLPNLGLERAIVQSLSIVFFYAVILYGNGIWLIPRVYSKGQFLRYSLMLFSFFSLVVALEMGSNYYIFGRYYGEKMYNFSFAQWAYTSFSAGLVVITSFLFYASLRYFHLLRAQNELKAQHYHSELSLLKAQVQPHFLFNTLNNIYYQAHKESPATALQIERLARMMRFFLEESPMEKILLSKEVEFIENYIELERLRMRYPLQLTFEYQIPETFYIPPMILIPFVENVFKHGINKRKTENIVSMKLEITDKRLTFEVQNLHNASIPANRTGFGLLNLRKRLNLLYGDDFVLTSEIRGLHFYASVNIPES
ncbi:histidine kinase [Pedobacter steynii]|nr:histidine kinase [Pedobacter steynii]NQX43204.1 histidine kinase [Pedobacter steynii]